MSVVLFPGQGSQYPGMAKDLWEQSEEMKTWFRKADELVGFDLSQVMFNGTEEDLKKTSVTQPAVFLNALLRFKQNEASITMEAVAGHSLGEFTALVANECLSFEDGLKLVSLRAKAMQEACDLVKGTMAAILGLEDKQVEDICTNQPGIVVAANYNCPGQLVISGELEAIEQAVIKAQEAGARRALILNVDGAFHSPLMDHAKAKLTEAINLVSFNTPKCPIYQNVTAKAESDPLVIKSNLVSQLTSPVRWTQSMKQMIADNHNSFIESGAKVLSGFLRRVDRSLEITQL